MNKYSVENCYFSELLSIETAVIHIETSALNVTVMRNTFENCASNDGTCGVKIGCLYSKIRQNCFSHLKTKYIDNSYDGGTAFSARKGFFDVSELSMIDVVQSKVLTHASFLASSSQCRVSQHNNSYGSASNYGTYSTAWDFISSTANCSYCAFFQLEGGVAIWANKVSPGRCHHLVFSNINSPKYLILNTESDYLIDDCICLNSNAKSSSPSAMSRWYFENCQNVGSAFVNKLSSPAFELEVILSGRCDLMNFENNASCFYLGRIIIWSLIFTSVIDVCRIPPST